MAQASATQSANERQTYNIPAGPLAPALRSLASAANIALAFTAEQANGKTSNPVRGRFTPQEALTVLLAHTGLQAVQLDNGGYVLRVVSVPAIEAVLPTVTASGHLEVADGPILGYVARRSSTGTKTDTPILETPQSITVIGAQEIETLKSQSLQDALGYAAGVTRAEGLDRTSDSLYLRGFRTTGRYRDGSLFTANIYDGRQEPYGLERIELLKGASSAVSYTHLTLPTICSV